MMRIVAPICLLVLCFLPNSDAFKCYDCLNCREPFIPEAIETGCSYCSKTTVQGRVARSCVYSGTAPKLGCNKTSSGGVKQEICYCNTDLCNLYPPNSGISCYHCDGESCNDPFNATATGVYIVKGCDYCSKEKVYAQGAVNVKQEVTRRCETGEPDQELGCRKGKKTWNGFEFDAKMCHIFCDTDDCNSASSFQISIYIISTAVVVIKLMI